MAAPNSVGSLHSASGVQLSSLNDGGGGGLTAANVAADNVKLDKLMRRMKGFDQTGKMQINMKDMTKHKRGTRSTAAAAAVASKSGESNNNNNNNNNNNLISGHFFQHLGSLPNSSR